MSTTCRSLITLTVVALAGLPIVAQDKVFTQVYDLHVPAAPLAGPRPDRTVKTAFDLPDGYEVVRDRMGLPHGARVTKDEDGLEEAFWSFGPTARGVEFEYKLKNSRSAPVVGRHGALTVELAGRRTVKMSLTPRYLAMRKRFTDDFLYGGLVAESIDPAASKVKFGDQTVYMGQALAVFATEAAILRDAGRDDADAKTRVRALLEALDELDRKAEPKLGGGPAKLDGFFLRDDITGPTDPRLAGRFKQVASDYQQGTDAAPSGDQLFSLMFGLNCVVKHAGDPALAQRAKETVARLYDYSARTKFILKMPDGKPVPRGAEVNYLASLLHGNFQSATGQDKFNDGRAEFLGIERPLKDLAGFWNDRLTQKFVADNAGKQIKVLGKNVELNSFALHILLTAIAPGDVWSHSAFETVAQKSSHQLAELVYCAAHNSLPRTFSRADIQKLLDACPPGGPKPGPATGWQNDSRWVRCTKAGDATTGSESFNGIDWMLLSNFAQLVYAGP